MKHLIVTTYDEKFDAVAEITTRNHLEYCRKHGYEYNVHHAPYKGQSTYENAHFGIVKAMLDYYDVVMTLGTDTLFMNYSITLESIFPKEAEQQIALEDIFDGGSKHNADVVLWRNTFKTRKLIDRIIQDRPKYGIKEWNWQGQLNELIAGKDCLVSGMNVVNAHVMNSYGTPGKSTSYKDGDFIIHFYLNTIEGKLAGVKEYISKVKK